MAKNKFHLPGLCLRCIRKPVMCKGSAEMRKNEGKK